LLLCPDKVVWRPRPRDQDAQPALRGGEVIGPVAEVSDLLSVDEVGGHEDRRRPGKLLDRARSGKSGEGGVQLGGDTHRASVLLDAGEQGIAPGSRAHLVGVFISAVGEDSQTKFYSSTDALESAVQLRTSLVQHRLQVSVIWDFGSEPEWQHWAARHHLLDDVLVSQDLFAGGLHSQRAMAAVDGGQAVALQDSQPGAAEPATLRK
jgi:hypothetical protein